MNRSSVFVTLLAAMMAASAAIGQAAPNKAAKQATKSSADEAVKVVSLRVDGNLAGRVMIKDADGQKQPVRARVDFLRNGKTLARVASDENGYFQVVQLKPGVYAVVGRTPSAFGASMVEVTPFVETTKVDYAGVFRTTALQTENDEAPEVAAEDLPLDTLNLELRTPEGMGATTPRAPGMVPGSPVRGPVMSGGGGGGLFGGAAGGLGGGWGGILAGALGGGLGGGLSAIGSSDTPASPATP